MQLKVLTITSLGYVAGGAEHYIVKIDTYLVDKGYNIKILASDTEPNKQHFNDYTFKNILSARLLKPLVILFNPFAFFSLRKVLKEYEPDIIHIHTTEQLTPSVLFLLKKHPTVMTLHGVEPFLRNFLIWGLRPSCFKHHVYEKNDLTMAGKFTYFYFNAIQKFLYRCVLKNIDLFIAPSKYMQSMAKVDVSPIIHLPYFIELRKFHELTNNCNLLFVGRLEKVKGVEFLIQALSLIIKVVPQTTLTIIGDGPNKPDLITLTRRLQLEKYIQFIGWVENKDLDPYYQKASIVIVPSIWGEVFGIVILEAMSVGRPVIGSNIGGIPEIIDDGVNGYVVEPENPEQIAEKVIKLLSEEKLLTDFGRNARKKSEDFIIEKHAEKVGKIYEEVIDKYKTAEPSTQLL